MTCIERDQRRDDRTTQVIQAVREVMNAAGSNNMNAAEVFKKVTKGPHSVLKLKKDELMEVLEHYKQLQIVYVDPEENIIFL